MFNISMPQSSPLRWLPFDMALLLVPQNHIDFPADCGLRLLGQRFPVFWSSHVTLAKEGVREETMDTKKVIGAMVAAFVILFAAGFLVHSVLLGPTYREMRDAGFSFRPEDAMRHKLWGIWVSDALYSILFVWVYAKGKEEKPWVSQGVRYGILMTLFTVVPSTLNDYVVYNLPHTLALHWMVAGLITLILMGLAAAAILKKPRA